MGSARRGTGGDGDGSGPALARSLDGTEIAYWTGGTGPPLVVVHGTPADHTRWRPLLPHLEPHATVHAMDRRGRCGSGDGPRYALAREFEDVAAAVDAVAEASALRWTCTVTPTAASARSGRRRGSPTSAS